MKLYLLSVICFLFMTACTKEVALSIPDSPKKYVIDGRVSNMKGPYYVRVTKTAGLSASYKPNQDLRYYSHDNAEPVLNAQVIITDDQGVADTLIPVAKRQPGRYRYHYNDGKIDSSFSDYFPISKTDDQGYYETTKLTGIPGHTYHLTVHIGDETFEASAYMPGETNLDSAKLVNTTNEQDGSEIIMPVVYFKEPQNEKNYYLLQDNPITDYPYDDPYVSYAYGGYFPYYVIDDKLLPAYVNGLGVRVITLTKFSAGNPYWFPASQPLQVRMGSITKETYDYYTALAKQFEADGNVYKPAPSSPAGNISNGALGLFWATGISYYMIMPK